MSNPQPPNMLQRGSLEDAKALAAEFSRARPPNRRGNQASGRGDGSGRERLAENRYRPNQGNPHASYNPPVLSGTMNPRGNTARLIPSQNLYSNVFPNTGSRRPAEPRGLPASYNAQLPARSGLTSFERTERILPPQGIAAPQNLGFYQGGSTMQRPVPNPAAVAPAPKPQGYLGINQPFQGYTGTTGPRPAESRPAERHRPAKPRPVDDEDVSMTDADAPSGYRRLGAKGLDASMWNTNGGDDGGAEDTHMAPPRPAFDRRPSNTRTNTSTSTIVSSGLVQGPGLANSRWA
ncbi:hypothetical protein F4820DRAFT_452591 [Hypoxylon rubiginosum]|uniref:Uncharacterized protein n=1 Tax=Hypoxylon rubiginosum TaxID=110542 RepID=A0ACB9YMZ9_9PEZI|nr:hypothetical protein F4820DRAFT_452591 [Hypoxylon rubiginosum]